MELYSFPELYDAVRAPDGVTLRFVRSLLKQHFNGSLTSLMDPACGPGTWLLPFARDGVRLAGNDLSPHMIEAARRQLNGSATELIEGDMRDLRFRTGPFDAALEIAGSIGHLPDDENVIAFLRAVAGQLRPGGLFLVNVPFEDPNDPDDLPAVYWSVGPISLPSGGQTSVVYEIVQKAPAARAERIRRTIRTFNAERYPPVIEDSYWLRVYTPSAFEEVLRQVPRFRLESAYRSTDDDSDWVPASLADLRGERLLVLRRQVDCRSAAGDSSR